MTSITNFACRNGMMESGGVNVSSYNGVEHSCLSVGGEHDRMGLV